MRKACAIAVLALLAGCAGNRDYGRDDGDSGAILVTEREQTQQRNWTEREWSSGGYTERKYNPQPYRERKWKDREYRDREMTDEPRNLRDRDPLDPETLPDD